MDNLWTDLLTSLAYVVLALLVLVVSRVVKDIFTPYKLGTELTEEDNAAVGLTITGYFAAVLIIYLGAVSGESLYESPTPLEFAKELGIDFLWALGGIFALNIGRIVVDKVVLPKFSTVKEIIEDCNVGTAAVEAGAFLATGLVLAGAISGSGSPLSALAFFGIGQLVLVLFSLIYNRLLPYDLHVEIERDNVAAGVAHGAQLVAIGIVLLAATVGDFVGWAENLQRFAYITGFGYVMLLLIRYVTDWVLLPRAKASREISEDQNLNVAWIEGVVSMGMAAVIFFMV